MEESTKANGSEKVPKKSDGKCWSIMSLYGNNPEEVRYGYRLNSIDKKNPFTSTKTGGIKNAKY